MVIIADCQPDTTVFYSTQASEQETLARLTMAIADSYTHTEPGVISLLSYQAVRSIAYSSVQIANEFDCTTFF
jgi:hypothetical protein